VSEKTPGEVAELRALIAKYENAITWDTSCLSCAAVLDSSIRDHERAERAEAERDRLRERLATLADELDRQAGVVAPSKTAEIKRDVAEQIRFALAGLER